MTVSAEASPTKILECKKNRGLFSSLLYESTDRTIDRISDFKRVREEHVVYVFRAIFA